MNVRSPHAAATAIDRYKTYGLFGGGALGGVIGALVSGPNFFVWSPAQSVGAIVGLAMGMAVLCYFFVELVVGGFAGSGASTGGQGEMNGSVDGGSAADGADGGSGGD